MKFAVLQSDVCLTATFAIQQIAKKRNLNSLVGQYALFMVETEHGTDRTCNTAFCFSCSLLNGLLLQMYLSVPSRLPRFLWRFKEAGLF